MSLPVVRLCLGRHTCVLKHSYRLFDSCETERGRDLSQEFPWQRRPVCGGADNSVCVCAPILPCVYTCYLYNAPHNLAVWCIVLVMLENVYWINETTSSLNDLKIQLLIRLNTICVSCQVGLVDILVFEYSASSFPLVAAVFIYEAGPHRLPWKQHVLRVLTGRNTSPPPFCSPLHQETFIPVGTDWTKAEDANHQSTAMLIVSSMKTLKRNWISLMYPWGLLKSSWTE